MTIQEYVKANFYSIQAKYTIKNELAPSVQNRFGSPNVARPYLKGVQLHIPYSLSLSAGFIDIETGKMFPNVFGMFVDAGANRKRLYEVLHYLNEQVKEV